MANQHDAKYVETSVTLHHHVDELLVGIIRQIRKQLNVTFPDISSLFNKKQKYTKGPRNFLKRILRLNKKNKEPVENVIEYWPVLYRIILCKSWCTDYDCDKFYIAKYLLCIDILWCTSSKSVQSFCRCTLFLQYMWSKLLLF